MEAAIGALLLGLGALGWRSHRATLDMQRRQRVEAWAAEYERTSHAEGGETFETSSRSWRANLVTMTLAVDVTSAEPSSYPPPSWSYELSRHTDGQWFQRETAASWAENCWRLQETAARDGLLKGSFRRALRDHLRSRPSWEPVSAAVEHELERHHQTLERLAATRPSVADMGHLAGLVALVHRLDMQNARQGL